MGEVASTPIPPESQWGGQAMLLIAQKDGSVAQLVINDPKGLIHTSTATDSQTLLEALANGTQLPTRIEVRISGWVGPISVE